MINLEPVGRTIGPTVHEYGWRDVVLYHLGIGARGTDLDLVYEGAPGGLNVCPAYATVTILEPMRIILSLFNVPLGTILHGEQVIFLSGSIPSRGKLVTSARVPAAYDKGKAALLILDTETSDPEGKVVFRTRASLFCRGLGGFGGDPGPKAEHRGIPSGRNPDFEISHGTLESQAALFRLSGDRNPLHIDPAAASAAGFARPVLHGLCTFGFACRAVLEGACGNEFGRLKEFGVRFGSPVFPGDNITTSGWDMGGGVFHLRAATGGGEVLTNAYALVSRG